MKNIALITSGGDAPGMNACVRAIVKTALNKNLNVFGIEDGYQGMIEGRGRSMTFSDVDNIIQTGGTILGTARSTDFLTPDGRKKAVSYLREKKIEGLIVVGGDGSFAGADQLSKEMDIHIIGVPGTIDNDIYGTDHTIGYDTALNTVTNAIDKIRDTATSHHRIFFVEVMGRDAGFIALNAAIATGSEGVLIPEEITDVKDLVENIRESNNGKRSTIIIVAEGDDAGGAMEIAAKVQPHLPDFQMRTSILGHIQRGGSPTALDRIIATRMGSRAVELLVEGKNKLMIGVKGDDLVYNSIAESIKLHSQPDMSKIELIEKVKTRNKV